MKDLVYIGNLYGEQGKYALYLFPKETEKDLAWNEGVKYCHLLGGEVPTLGELQYLYDYHKEKFQNASYWSSSQSSDTGSWRVYFDNGSRASSGKMVENRVRPVKRVLL